MPIEIFNAVVDSSGWIEFFEDSKRADYFEQAITNTDFLVVPSIVLYEVVKKYLRESGEAVALKVQAQMTMGQVVDCDELLAQQAAILAVRHQLPTADSIIYATAQRFKAKVLTQDADFEGLEGVEYFAK